MGSEIMPAKNMIFPDILGHNRVLRFLERIMENDRLAHAYLFSGPDGVGKAAVALRMAASLLCADNQELSPCKKCPACIQFVSSNHPDFIHIVPDGVSIRIDRIRELKKQLVFSPFAGGTRVILIEEAQSMRREAANSLLKILEEPPPGNIFLLVAAESEPVLATITSRCQVISFSPLSDEITANIVSFHRSDLNRQQLLMVARMSGGRPGQALTIKLDGVFSLWEQIITAMVSKWLSPAKRVEKTLLLAREAAMRDDLDLLFDLLRLFLKDSICFFLQGLEGDKPVFAGSVEMKFLVQARERWSLPQLSDKMDSIDSAAGALADNCNRGLVCEVLMSRLIIS